MKPPPPSSNAPFRPGRARFAAFAAGLASCLAVAVDSARSFPLQQVGPPEGGHYVQLVGPPERGRSEGKDVVTLRLESGGRIVQQCTILEYDGRSIRFRTEAGGDSVVAYPASQVIEVQTAWLPAHSEGRALFERGRYAEAAESLERALRAEAAEPRREWVRREILALLVRCALAAGDHSAARHRFDLLVESDAWTRHFGLAPLAWSSAPVGERDSIEARVFLGKRRDASRLIGASLLLLDPKFGELAQVEMRKLLSSPEPHVGALAEAQQWRLRRRDGGLRPDHLDHWRKRIEALPPDQRGGPYYVLGGACLDRREYDRAAAALLWLPLVDHADAHLAARAGVEAAEALALIGQKPQAIGVCREILRRFSQTPFAQDAQGLIASLEMEEDAP